MRTLKFIVDGQIIKKDPNCDFDNIVPGSKGYLQAEFSFSSDWDGTVRVVGFWNKTGECPPQVLKDGRTCMIPDEAAAVKRFEICVLGKKGDLKLKTNEIEICQNGGKA